MSSYFLIFPILLGLLLGVFHGRIEAGYIEFKPSAVLEPGPLNEKVFKETADINALRSLQPPQAGADSEQWLQFAHSLKDIDTGSRYGHNDVTSALLSWYVYIARQHPQTIYTLLQENQITDRVFDHLVQFGLLPDWYEQLPNADELLLGNSNLLRLLALERGTDDARRLMQQAFFADGEKHPHLNMQNLLFALPVMSEDELAQVLPRLHSARFRLDPRQISTLQYHPYFAEQGQALPALIQHAAQGPYQSGRSMASYLLDSAALGDASAVQSLIQDAGSNAGQPTNFYCAVCYLALEAEGPLGVGLLELAKQNTSLPLTREQGQWVILSKDTGGKP